MAKRFTDTEKWRKGFIRSLPAPYKLLWLYILDECDMAGIWHVELDVANVRIMADIESEDAVVVFGDHIIPFDSGEKWFIPNFIAFQYGELNKANRVHQSVMRQLDRYGLLRGVISPLESPSQRAKEKDKEKAKAKALEKAKEKAKAKDKDKDKDNKKAARQKYPPGYSTPVWKAYCEGFEKRYGTTPKANSKNYKHCQRIRERLGLEDAVSVASYYPLTRNAYHVGRGHSLACLESDCEKVWTEWTTGQQITMTGAREGDRLEKTGAGWQKLIDQAEKEQADES